jgi:putative flippase GtrA
MVTILTYGDLALALARKHRKLLIGYAAVGTAAAFISAVSLRLLMESTKLGHTWSFVVQFLPILVFHYYLIRRYVIKEDHFYWRKHLPRLGFVKGCYAGASLGMYEVFLAHGLPYLAALPASQAFMAVPGFLLTVFGAFRKPQLEEVKA